MIFTDTPEASMPSLREETGGRQVWALVGPIGGHTSHPDLQDALGLVCMAFNRQHGRLSAEKHAELFKNTRGLELLRAADLTRPTDPGEDKVEAVAKDRFYIDCEFDGHGGPLLSMAMVREDGCSLHVQTTEDATDPWVKQNVVPLLSQHEAQLHAIVPLVEVGKWLRAFTGDVDRPVIIADSPVDIGRFCAALSTGEDGGWCSTGYPHMTFEVHNVDCYPTDLPGAVQHNAYWDAMALRHKLTAIAAMGHTPPSGEDG
jgi:hypothetical protein